MAMRTGLRMTCELATAISFAILGVQHDGHDRPLSRQRDRRSDHRRLRTAITRRGWTVRAADPAGPDPGDSSSGKSGDRLRHRAHHLRPPEYRRGRPALAEKGGAVCDRRVPAGDRRAGPGRVDSQRQFRVDRRRANEGRASELTRSGSAPTPSGARGVDAEKPAPRRRRWSPQRSGVRSAPDRAPRRR